MNVGRTAKLAGAIAAVLVLAGIIWLVVGALNQPLPKVVLPDGTEVKLLKVTYGTNHLFHTATAGNRLLDYLYRILPGRLVTATPLQLTSTNNSLACWLRIRASNPNQQPYLEWTVTDPDGLNCGGSSPTTGRTLPGGDMISGVLFRSFPRRSQELLLQNIQYDPQAGRRRLMASFTLRNPARQKFAEWVAPPPPISARDGDIEFTLTRLVGGLSRGGEYRKDDTGRQVRVWHRATNSVEASALAAFRASRGGQVLTNWQPVKIWATDATGNISENSSWSNETQGDEALMIYQWGLWPQEPAWKLRVQFSRLSGFAPDELWTIQGFSTTNLLPKSKWWNTAGTARDALAVLKTNLLGAELRIMPLLANETAELSKRVELTVLISPGSDDYRLTLVQITDQNGKPVNRSGTSWSAGSYEFTLENLPEARSLNLILAYHRSRFAEFLAKPELAK